MGKLIVEGVDLTDLRGVPYVASRHPGNVSVEEFLLNPQLGANCQLLGLGALRKGGYYIDETLPMDQGGRFGSKELWLDTRYTEFVARGECSPEVLMYLFLDGKLRAFDFYFFLPPDIFRSGTSLGTDPELLKKLHVAVWLGLVEVEEGGNHFVWLHNAKPGPSALWTLQDFFDRRYSLFGVKRPTRRMQDT